MNIAKEDSGRQLGTGSPRPSTTAGGIPVEDGRRNGYSTVLSMDSYHTPQSQIRILFQTLNDGQ